MLEGFVRVDRSAFQVWRARDIIRLLGGSVAISGLGFRIGVHGLGPGIQVSGFLAVACLGFRVSLEVHG